MKKKKKQAVAFLKKSSAKNFRAVLPLASTRHCERSEAIHLRRKRHERWIATPARNDGFGPGATGSKSFLRIGVGVPPFFQKSDRFLGTFL
jgi:hypothetical protein